MHNKTISLPIIWRSEIKLFNLDSAVFLNSSNASVWVPIFVKQYNQIYTSSSTFKSEFLESLFKILVTRVVEFPLQACFFLIKLDLRMQKNSENSIFLFINREALTFLIKDPQEALFREFPGDFLIDSIPFLIR